MNIQEQALTKLKCTRCHLYLSVAPITTNSGTNFFCGRCPNGGTQVKIYEVLAENFSFPCRYQQFGCKEITKWGSVQAHENNCNKKPHLCPAVPPGVCLWRGAMDDIPTHFQETHTEDVTDMNIIEIQFHENVEGCKLINIGKDSYIFHVYFNRAQKLLKLNVAQLKEKSNKSKYQLKLYTSDSSKKITLAADYLTPYDSMDHNKIKDANVIDASVLKFLTTDNPSIFCEILLNVQKKRVNSELLKLLECPVCNECMGSPIYQCQTGHSFCNPCISKLKDCPLCHKDLTKTRNYALEDLACQVSHYCKNKEFGCHYNGSFEDVNTHEEACGIYKCPLQTSQKCSWNGNYLQLLEHCKSNHIYLETENYGLLCSLTVDKCGVFRLIHSDGMFFRICRKFENEEFNIVIQFVGPTEKSTDYLYEFSFISISNNQTELLIKDCCQPLTDDKDAFNNCFIIPYCILKKFESNNKLKCNLKIVKKQDVLTV